MIAGPHVVEMWMAALWATWVERGDVLAMNERMTESAELAKLMGLIEGRGKDARVIEVYAPARKQHGWQVRVVLRDDPRLVKAERAFRSLWEAREERSVNDVTEWEARAMQREALSLVPGGKVSAPRIVRPEDIDDELTAVGW
jgi:hypothetical protein